jgi:hypothetical protein
MVSGIHWVSWSTSPADNKGYHIHKSKKEIRVIYVERSVSQNSKALLTWNKMLSSIMLIESTTPRHLLRLNFKKLELLCGNTKRNKPRFPNPE